MHQQQPPQPFYMVDPPKSPKPGRSWALPLFAGVITTGLSVIAFGFIAGSQSSDPQPVPTASLSPDEVSTSTPQVATPSPSSSPSVETHPITASDPRFAAVPDPQFAIPFARVFCDKAEVINFRAAPSLSAQVLDVLGDGELVEPVHPPDIVESDGSSWIEVRYRNRTGWIVSKFVGHE